MPKISTFAGFTGFAILGVGIWSGELWKLLAGFVILFYLFMIQLARDAEAR